jgi:hypothetical protein
MSMIERQVRAAQAMVRIELRELREFCRDANAFFKRKIDKFEREVSGETSPRTEDDDMYLSDYRMELEGRLELTGYFGIVMVFATLERFLHRIYEGTMNLAVEPELEDVVSWLSNKWVPVGEFRTFLKKLGVDVSGKQFDWNEINKVIHLRNAIVHQGGMVTDANVKFLSPLGYKELQRVKVSMSDVEKNIKLVERTVKEIGQAYLSALRNKKLIS